MTPPITWQPIETAPKDGSIALLYFPDGTLGIGTWLHKKVMVNGQTVSDHQYWSRLHSNQPVRDFDYPTHWLPVPPLPEANDG
jgi:hypothetical protein